MNSTAPIVYGHRGDSAHAPENSLSAFARVREISGRHEQVRIGVELDVQLTTDGETVVFHDYDLQRMAGRQSRICDTGYGELAGIDIGSRFDARFAAERIPRLADVFDLLGDSVEYDIELKHETHGETGLEAAVARAIEQRGLAHRCLVSSFNPYALRAFRRHAPQIPIALIYANDPDVPRSLRRGAGRYLVAVDVLKPRWQQARAALRPLRLGRRRPVLPWTVNDPELARDLVARGCIGVISDDPRAIAAALQTPHPS